MYEECEYPWFNPETPTFFRKFSFTFQQTWTHIVVRIKLINDASISDDVMNNLKTQWNKGIVDIWNNQWGCGLPGEATCRLTFEVQFVGENEHKTVSVVPGVVSFSTGEVVRANTGKWHTFMPGNVAAHEYGHYIGNTDHYREESVCLERRILYPGSVMDNNTANVPAGLVSRLATNIGSEIVPIK
jgi:hypothetical protein